MKKLFSITLFFWACTCTQQAQHIPFEFSMDKNTIRPKEILASSQKSELLMPVGYQLSELEKTHNLKF